MEQTEKAYWNHEIAKVLGIGESTLRKWCIELEKNGYEFVKGAKDSRAFLENDLQALTYFKQLTKTEKMPQETAAKSVVERFSKEIENGRTIPVPFGNSQNSLYLEETVNQLLEHSKKQEEFNKALIQRLEQQEKYISESLEKRDKLLMENIRASQEQKLLLENIRTSQEQAAVAQEGNKFQKVVKKLFGIK